MIRQATDKILQMVEEGVLDRDTVIMSCLKYMSEDDVGTWLMPMSFLSTRKSTMRRMKSNVGR